MRTVMLLAAFGIPFHAEPLTHGDRDFAMSHLHASRKAFLDSIAGLSEEQWKFKPAPDRWSIGEVAEHIALSEVSLFQLITEKAMKSEPAAERKAASREADEQFVARIRDRSKKGNAPDFLQPAGKWPTPEALIADFKKNRENTIAYAETTQDDLRGHEAMNLRGWQWLLLISAHAERHVAQINEVKADPRYPR
jgi:hypothetical protein